MIALHGPGARVTAVLYEVSSSQAQHCGTCCEQKGHQEAGRQPKATEPRALASSLQDPSVGLLPEPVLASFLRQC